MKVVIVESPAKARTIEKFLGSDYRVEASYGHIRDLPSSAKEIPAALRKKPWARMAVDTENDFTPIYVVPKESQKRVKELKKIVSKADEVLLATDEDREGESISWHLLEVLEPTAPVRRITFHEITRAAIREALERPRDVDEKLVRAQEARRILDRLFGYSLSPVLWKRVRTKLSAGRVQSVALRLIVEREEERQRFVSSEYWDVEASLGAADSTFAATLVSVDGARVASGKDFDATTGALDPESAATVLGRAEAESIADGAAATLPWVVSSVDRKQARQRPAPPFTTSTLQQAASSRLRMSPKQTMRIAQRLYEGIDLGGGEREGLITYMRTDSLTLSEKALDDAAAYIEAAFGADYYAGKRRYKTKAKSAQEAHEAIRPTEMGRSPQALAKRLDRDELRLYRLIWERAVASQMVDALIDRTTVELTVELDGAPNVFRANGSVLRFPGFLAVGDGPREDAVLPPLEEGQRVGGEGDAIAVLETTPVQHETRPPARYTEASLVKKLEEEGIGRPSTYTPTISTIQERNYVVKKSGQLIPTYVGMAVTHLLRDHFAHYVDITFTAQLEDQLDSIAAGETDWVDFLSAFYSGDTEGEGLRQRIEEELPKIAFPAIPVGADPETGEAVFIKIGRSSVYAQRGDGDDADRATIPADLLIDELTVERALELIEAKAQSDEPLGEDDATREQIYLRVGPYGPYLQLGEGEEGSKPKRVSLPRGVSPSDVDLDYARKLLSLPRLVGADPESGAEVTAGLGRYGPYVHRDGVYQNLPSVDEVFTITLPEALEKLAQKGPGKTVIKELGPHPESGADIKVLSGRYGPYVTDGSVNASLAKGADPAATTVEAAVALLAERAKKGKGKKRGRGPGKARGRKRG